MATRARKRRDENEAVAETTDTQGGEPSPAAGLFDSLGLADRAYKLHLRGMSVRAIGEQLQIDKTTAARYVKQVEREMAPRRREAREKLLRGAIARLRGIALEASEQLDALARETGEHGTDARGAAALLNTRLNCEREIARLQGLFDQVLDDEDGTGTTGIRITISHRTITAGAEPAGRVEGGDG